MKSAIYRVIKKGDREMAIALQEEYLEIEASNKKPVTYVPSVPAEIKISKSELRKINRLPRDRNHMVNVNDLTSEVIGYAPSYVNGFFTPNKEYVHVIGDLNVYVDPFKSSEHKIHVKDAPELVERLWALND